MNNTQTSLKKKLTAVSMYCNGKKVQAFVMADVGTDGKSRVPRKVYEDILAPTGARRGDTITVG